MCGLEPAVLEPAVPHESVGSRDIRRDKCGTEGGCRVRLQSLKPRPLFFFTSLSDGGSFRSRLPRPVVSVVGGGVAAC